MQVLKAVKDSKVNIRGKNIPGRRTVQCKGPEAQRVGLYNGDGEGESSRQESSCRQS